MTTRGTPDTITRDMAMRVTGMPEPATQDTAMRDTPISTPGPATRPSTCAGHRARADRCLRARRGDCAAWLAGSLALLSDAGHMVTDAASLGLALFAQRIAARPPSERASYGYARAEVLAAFVNALALLALVVFIAIEAVRRLLDPQPVAGAWVLGIAAVGLVVNLRRVGRAVHARRGRSTRAARCCTCCPTCWARSRRSSRAR